jgi:hypothetical protein
MAPKTTKRPELPTLPPPPEKRFSGPFGTRYGTQGQALAALTADAGDEGKRIVVFGASRKGKTTFVRELASDFLAHGIAERLIVHDQKFLAGTQYKIQGDPALATSSAELQHQFLRSPIIIAKAPVDAEDCARLIREGAETAGIRSCLILDEGAYALKHNDEGEPIRQTWEGPNLTWLQLQGGAGGSSSISLWQMPVHCPSSALDNASAFVAFGLGGRSLAYTRDLRIIPADAVDVVTCLGVGQLCLFWPDREWDRTIYGPKL